MRVVRGACGQTFVAHNLYWLLTWTQAFLTFLFSYHSALYSPSHRSTMTSRYGLSSIATTPLALHDIGTHDIGTYDIGTIQPYEPHAEIHIDSSQVPPPQNQATYIQYSRNNPLGLRGTGFSEAGASSGHWGSPGTRASTPQPTRRAIQGYTIEGGWQQDEFGNYRRAEGGRIEEINHDVYGDATSPGPHGNPNQALSYVGSMKITSPLPRSTTPPPRPMPRTVHILRGGSTPAGSVRGIAGPSRIQSRVPSRVPSRAPSPLNFTSPPLTRLPEADILTTNLHFVDTALNCVDSLSLVGCSPYDITFIHQSNSVSLLSITSLTLTLTWLRATASRLRYWPSKHPWLDGPGLARTNGKWDRKLHI